MRKRLLLCLPLFMLLSAAQDPEVPDTSGPSLRTDNMPGAKSFEGRCQVCHGADGNGSDRAPGIVAYVLSATDDQIGTVIRQGIPDQGMPAHALPAQEMKDLLALRPTSSCMTQSQRLCR
jgi:mono/diheme cytochrome c family protein